MIFEIFKYLFFQGCNKGWVEKFGTCYSYVNQKKAWKEAELFCQNKGGHLTSIMNSAENSFVYRLTPMGNDNYWIGM